MKSRTSTWLKIACIALIPMLLLTTGCAKRDAQKAQVSAQTAKDAASSARAPGYAPNEFKDANTLFMNAEQQFNNGEYKQSIATYQSAEGRFKNAERVATEQGPRIQAAVQKIEDALAMAEENVQKARDGGGLQPEEINPVDQAVQDKKTDFEGNFRNEADIEKLNDFLTQVEQVVKQTESLALAHLKPLAATAKDEVQVLVDKAQELKADTHVPDQYNQAMAKFNEMQTAERDGQWQQMIDLAGELKTPLNQIIIASQEKAAGDILRQTEQTIAEAKQINLQLDGFTNAIQQAETALQNGKTKLQSQDYAGAIASADVAKTAITSAYQAVSQQAQQLIDSAKTNLQNAIDQEAKTYAPSVVTQVQEAIAGAEELLQSEKYTLAYTTARNAQQASGKAVDAARRGKAQVALQKAEKPFSLLHSQGGAKYAKEAYGNAVSALEDLRSKMKSGEFEAVVEGVPSAVQVVQTGIEALAQSGAKMLAQTNAALKNAQKAKAQEWVAMQYANAINYRDAAEKDLKAKRFLSSFRQAESSMKAAQEAEGKSYQLRAEQNQRNAAALIKEARRAEQNRLSPLAYRQAVQAFEETASLLKNRQNQEAYSKSVVAAEKADQALNNLVIVAREKTDSALTAKAMTYSQPEIEEALAFLNRAEEAQTAKQYTAANENSIESAKLAEKAEDFTWKQRSYALLRSLEGLKAEMENHLAPEKAPAIYREALSNLADAKVQQIDRNFKTCYEYADKARQNRDAAWSSMNGDLNQTLAELKQTADWMGKNALDADGRDLKLKLLETIPPLEQQIGLQNWCGAYAAAENCLKIAGKVSGTMETQNRKIMAKRLNESLVSYRQDHVLNVVPDESKKIDEALRSLKSPHDGETYSDAYQKYQEATAEIRNLPKAIETQATQQAEEIALTLQQANDAGATNFYKDWYRKLSSELQLLRNAIRGNAAKDIAAHLKKLEKEAPELLVATQIAVDEDNYLQALERQLNLMNNVLQDFGFLAELPKDLIVAARSTEYKLDKTVTNMYRAMQGKVSVRTFRINAELLEEAVKDMDVPKSMKSIQKKAIASFIHFRKASEGFEAYGQSDMHDIYFRERALKNAYAHLEESAVINEALAFEISGARKLSKVESVQWKLKNIEKALGRFYYNWQTD